MLPHRLVEQCVVISYTPNHQTKVTTKVQSMYTYTLMTVYTFPYQIYREIRESFLPRKFSAIQYTKSYPLLTGLLS